MSFHRTNRTYRIAGRLIFAVLALLLAMFVAIQLTDVAAAQSPADEDIVLVNQAREFVERKKEGGFIARPVYNQRIDNLFYGVRDGDTGDWITPVYTVLGGERQLAEGWEYSWEYPGLPGQQDLDPNRAYLLAMVADVVGGHTQAFHAIIPIHRPTSIWDRMIAALDPALWARAAATWVVEGTHGTLCGVVERASGVAPNNCGGG